jgi:hypothetical protein
MGETDALRNWGRDPDDRCPVCYVPPGTWHLPGECIHSGMWKGPKKPRKLPDSTVPGDVPSDRNPPAADHDVSGGTG